MSSDDEATADASSGAIRGDVAVPSPSSASSVSVSSLSENSNRANQTPRRGGNQDAPENVSAATSELNRRRREEFDGITRTGTKPSDSYVWMFIDLIQLDPDLPEEELTATHKLVVPNGKKDCICNLCVSLNKPLKDCIRTCKGLATNVNSHIKTVHRDEYDKYMKAEAEKKRKYKFFSAVKSKKVPVPSEQTNLTSVPPPPPSKTPHRDQFDKLIFEAVNDNAFPVCTVEKTNFRDMLMYALHNGKTILREGWKPMGRMRFLSTQLGEFDVFCSRVSNLVAEIDQHYVEVTGSHQRFITISHDVWDGKGKEVIGLSLFFADPRDMETYAIPVCLLKAEGKKSVEISESSLHGLEKYNIKQHHLFAPMNDNTNSALKAGKLIVGLNEHDEAGRCNMHWPMLMYGHATSEKKRKEGGRVVDKFQPFLDLDKANRSLANKINTSHFLSIFKETCNKEGLKAYTIPVGNETRCGGSWMLQQELLRQKYSVQHFTTNCVAMEKHNLLLSQWKLMAQFEALARPVCQLAFNVQGDRIEGASEAIVRIANLWAKYDSAKFNVVTFDSSHGNVPWDADTPFNEIPKKKMTTKQSDVTEKVKLMAPEAIMLHRRYIREFKEYYEKPTKRQVLAMSVSLPMVTAGIQDLTKIIGDDYASNLIKQMKDGIVEAVEVMTRDMKPEHFAAYFGISLPSSSTSSVRAVGMSSDDESDTDDDEDDDDPLSRIAKKRRMESPSGNETLANSPSADAEEVNVKERALKEYESFIGQEVDWNLEIRAQYKRMHGLDMPKSVEDEHDWDKIAGGHSLYISSKFDLCEYWQQIGKTKYKLCFLVVPQTIALLDHNGMQERVFSTCTFFNSSLRRRLGEKKFEMAVLLTVNRTWINEMRTQTPSSDKSILEVARDILGRFGVDVSSLDNYASEEGADDSRVDAPAQDVLLEAEELLEDIEGDDDNVLEDVEDEEDNN